MYRNKVALVVLGLIAISYVAVPMVHASEDSEVVTASPSPSVRPLNKKFMEIKENILKNKEERQENRDDRQEERQEKREDRQEDRQENREEKLENAADRVEKRFQNHEQKLSSWLARAEKHVTELKSKGKDTTAAEKSIATAKSSLTNAVTLGKTGVAQLRAIDQANWKTQKPEVVAAKEAIKKAQAAFVAVLKDIRLILVELKKLRV